MATWVRTGNGILPTATDSNLTANVTLDNGTAPADFDPAGVTSVQIDWRLTIAGLSDDTWTDHQEATLRSVAVTVATVDGGNATRTANGNYDHSLTDNSPNTGLTVAQWEGATFGNTGNPSTVMATYNQTKGKDGTTATIPVANIVVTITYTPGAIDFTGSTTAASSTGSGTLAVDHNFTGSTTAASATPTGFGYLDLPNADNSPVTTADKAQLDITGDIEVIFLASATDWQGGAESPGWILNKFGNSSTRSYALGFSSSSLLQWGVNDGTSTFFPTASGAVQTTTGVADGSHLWVRARIDVSVADAIFWYSLDDIDTDPTAVSWTSWTGGAGFTTAFSINATTNDLELGRFDTSNSGTWDGRIYYVGIYDGWQGAGGTLVAETDWRTADVTSDGLGNTWTKSGSAAWVPGAAVITVTAGTGPVTFTGTTTAASSTGNGTLVIDHNFSGSTTAASTTGNGTISIVKSFTGGDATGASTTGAGTLAVTHNFSGSTTAASTTGSGTLAVDHNFSGTTVAASSTGNGTLAVVHNFTGSTTAASTTGDATLSTAKVFTGTTTATSTTGDGTLQLTVGLSGSTVTASSTGNGTLTVTKTFAGSTVTASTTGNGTLAVTHNFSGSTTAASTTGDAVISTGKLFTGTTVAASSTGNGTLLVVHNFAGSTTMVSSTGTGTLAVTHVFNGSTTAASTAGDATLDVIANTRMARVTWSEMELGDGGRTALITWAEMELGDGARQALVTWAELEIPDATRTAQVTWAVLEVPSTGALTLADVAGKDELGILRTMAVHRYGPGTYGDRAALYRLLGSGNGDIIAALNQDSKELAGAICDAAGVARRYGILAALRQWAISDNF